MLFRISHTIEQRESGVSNQPCVVKVTRVYFRDKLIIEREQMGHKRLLGDVIFDD